MGKIYNSILGLLIVLIGILFYLQFKKPSNTNTRSIVTNGVGLPIAYFEPDSIISKYKFSIEKIKDLEVAVAKANDELSKFDAEFETQNKKYDAMPDGDEKLEASLALQNLRQKVMSRKETAEKNMEEAKQKFQMELRKNIEVYIKKLNTPQRFSMIISSDPSFIYFKDSALDITNEIIDGLNKEYK